MTDLRDFQFFPRVQFFLSLPTRIFKNTVQLYLTVLMDISLQLGQALQKQPRIFKVGILFPRNRITSFLYCSHFSTTERDFKPFFKDPVMHIGTEYWK